MIKALAILVDDVKYWLDECGLETDNDDTITYKGRVYTKNWTKFNYVKGEEVQTYA